MLFKKKQINRRKKLRISIGVKLISIISLIIIISLSSMILLASYFFKNDSEIRIKENNHKISEVIALKVKTDFLSILKMANYTATALLEKGGGKKKGESNLQNFFDKDNDIIFIGIGERNGKGSLHIKQSISNIKFLDEKKISSEKITQNIYTEKKYFEKSFNTEQVVHNVSPFFKMPIIGISIPFRKINETAASSILIVYVSMNPFLEAVKSPGTTKTFIINSEGDLIAHHDTSLVSAKVNFSKLEIVKKMMKSPVDNGQIRYMDEKGIYFQGSFKKVGFANTGVIATVEEDIAYKAVNLIRKRNFLITIIVLNLAILIVYFFAKTLTGPIGRLVSATKEIEAGNFNITITDMPSDEIGLLMRSFNEMGRGLAEREKMKDAFGKFVNKEIAEMVLRDEIKLGGERKHAAVFFSDIRSFTAISEKLEPEEVVEFLNQYMTRMVNCVNQNHGVVDKFIGDAIMAIWGAPLSHGNDTENAVNSALMMRKSLIEFNQGRGGIKKPIIKIGCGINTGPVLAGQIGSQDKMEYTVIGDTVNLASRIESLNKPFGTDILITEEAYTFVKEIYNIEKMQKITVKGKTEPQQIYAVLGRRDDPECPASLTALQKILGIDKKDLPAFDPDEKEVKFKIIDEKKKKNTK